MIVIRKDLCIPQNGQVGGLNCFPMCKKIRKSFKTSELKAQVDSQKEAWKREDMYVSVGKGTLLSI